MKVAIIVMCLAVVALEAANLPSRHHEFELFKHKFGRQYENEAEELRRMQIFFNNLDLIEVHNSKFQRGESRFTLGVNQFADMTNEEYRAVMLLPHRNRRVYTHPEKGHVRNPLQEDPASVDWRPLGYVTPVKDQGQCGSCWAFSTTGMLEGAYFNWTGELVSLSEQNLMDCSTDYGNAGCNGGWQEYATEYVRDNGIEREVDYPYTAKHGQCNFDPTKSVTTCGGFVWILPRGDEIVQRSAVATQGPVSFSMDASQASFQLYKSGVYDDPLCLTGFYDMDHAVLGVGYGTDARGVEYWIVKNSWGTSWGEQGYFNILRGNNTCGIATDSLYVFK